MRRRGQGYQPERVWMVRGWRLSFDRNWEPPIELYVTWVDQTTAYAALTIGARGSDPFLSLCSPDFHPTGRLARLIDWIGR